MQGGSAGGVLKGKCRGAGLVFLGVLAGVLLSLNFQAMAQFPPPATISPRTHWKSSRASSVRGRT